MDITFFTEEQLIEKLKAQGVEATKENVAKLIDEGNGIYEDMMREFADEALYESIVQTFKLTVDET